MMGRSTISALVVWGLWGLCGAGVFAQSPPTVVRVAPVEMREVQPHHRITGSLRAVARGDVAALEEGRVVEVTVREGAEVRTGDVIARLDTRRLDAQQSELEASLLISEANIAQRTAELEQRRLDLARREKLVENQAATAEDYEHRETEVAVAEALLLAEQRRVAEIESQLQLLSVRLEDMEVRAPYDGRVVERHAEPGEWIRAGEPFITLVSSGRIEAWLDVPERYAHQLTVAGEDLPSDGVEITIRVPGSDCVYRALSAKRVPEVHPRTRTFAFVLTLDDADGALSPGMSVDAWLPMGEEQPRLTVPRDAVIRNGRTAFVYKVLEEQGQATAVQSPVNVEFETGGRVVVSTDTLSAGDQVVVEGNERLIPGAPVSVAAAGPALRREVASADR